MPVEPSNSDNPEFEVGQIWRKTEVDLDCCPFCRIPVGRLLVVTETFNEYYGIVAELKDMQTGRMCQRAGKGKLEYYPQ